MPSAVIKELAYDPETQTLSVWFRRPAAATIMSMCRRASTTRSASRRPRAASSTPISATTTLSKNRTASPTSPTVAEPYPHHPSRGDLDAARKMQVADLLLR